MSKNDILEQIFSLKELQANCTANERQALQNEIMRLYRLLDSTN